MAFFLGKTGAGGGIRTLIRIPMNLATDSGVNSPPVGAKRRWDFIIAPCGWDESSLKHVSSWILLSVQACRHSERLCP